LLDPHFSMIGTETILVITMRLRVERRHNFDVGDILSFFQILQTATLFIVIYEQILLYLLNRLDLVDVFENAGNIIFHSFCGIITYLKQSLTLLPLNII